MFRRRLRSILQKQLVPMLILVIVINCLGAFARECRSDEYFDVNTQNCDPCSDVCAAGDCSRECPNYRIQTSSPSTTTANATASATASATSTTTIVLFGTGLGTFEVVIIAAVCFLLAMALLVIVAYKMCCRKKKNGFTRKVTTEPIEESEKSSNSEIVPLNNGIQNV